MIVPTYDKVRSECQGLERIIIIVRCNVHSIADIMMNTGWQVQNRHAQMFQAISNVLFPLK